MKKINEFFNFEENNRQEINKINIDWNVHANLIVMIGKHYESNFKVDKNNQRALKEMLLYFTGNELFSGNLNKGLMLIGEVGTGKSLLFKIFKKYTKDVIRTNGYQMHPAIDIIDNVNIQGVECLNIYSNNFEGKQAHPIRCYIDDIATNREKVKHYGTEINVIEQLLSLRYNVFQRYGTLTHISSNKYPEELSAQYDERIIDRMKEMFNIIELEGSSRRK